MKIPLTPAQASRILNVASVTVYKWIEAGKLKAVSVKAGHSTRLHLDPDDVELKRIELEAESTRSYDADKPMDTQAKEWVDKYHGLLGKVPPLYTAFRKGEVTLEQMKAEASRRFDLLR